jgi:hypothetical protein
MSTVHSTPDWDETTCGLSLWDEIQDGDEVIAEIFDPSARASGKAPCLGCYPEDGRQAREALWVHWGAKHERP